MSSGDERIREQVARRRDDLLDLTARDRLLAAVRIDGERGEVRLR